MINSVAIYQNGNVNIELLSDGTRTSSWSGDMELNFPLQVDLKLTNYCDLGDYCKWCHEGSNKEGAHADISKAIKFLKGMPKGTEIAIGGGNPLAHPSLTGFLIMVRSLGLVPNMTVNELHLKRYKDELEELIERKLIFGLGISYSGKQKKLIKHFAKMNPNTVVHMIAGVNELKYLDDIEPLCKKVLILGYKKFGKGKKFFSKEVEDKLYQWYIRLPIYFNRFTLSFDNLAISQLNLKRYFPESTWKEFYQGDEGSISFYIDAVKEEFAVNSTSEDRFDIGSKGVKEMFAHIKENSDQK